MSVNQYEDYFLSHDLPSSPEQVAVFSPEVSSEDEYIHSGYYFEPYQRNDAPGKMNNYISHRHSRRAATSALPLTPHRQVKRESVQNVVPLASYAHMNQVPESCYYSESSLSSSVSLESLNSYDLSSSPALSSYQYAPTSCEDVQVMPQHHPFVTPSRVKSTTPNLALLFSLFDVLETTSQVPAKVQATPSSAPETRSPPPQVPEVLVIPSSKYQIYQLPEYSEQTTFQWMNEQEPSGFEYSEYPLPGF